MFSGPPKQTFHTKECRKLWLATQREAARAVRPSIDKACEFCGGPIEETQDSLGRRIGMQNDYCGSSCRDKASLRRDKIVAGLDPDVDGRTERKLAPRTIEILDAVRAFLDVDNPVGVRSCCYHLLSLGILKSTREFDGAQAHIKNARLRDEDDPNFLPDDAFVDRSRKLEYLPGYSNAEECLDTVRRYYSRNHWADQPTVPIILTEKDGYFFLNQVTDSEHVRLFLSKGVHGRSHLCKLADHCAQIIKNGQHVRIGYVGDFDADGIRMEIAAENGNDRTGVARKEGLRQILANKHGIYDHDALDWIRLGLTVEQLLDLPTPAKVAAKRTSNNFEWYAAEYAFLFEDQVFTTEELEEAFADEAKDYDTHVYGGEADALGFDKMKVLVKEFIDSCKDDDLWTKSEATEASEVEALSSLTL
jgi:hypothetical protein